MPYTAVEIAKLIGGTVIGDGNTTLTGIAPAVSAKSGDLTFHTHDSHSLISAIAVCKADRGNLHRNYSLRS